MATHHLKPIQHRGSLRRQLIVWFLILAIVPMAVLSLITFSNARDGLTEKAEIQLSSDSQATTEYINAWFDYRLMDIQLQTKNVGSGYFLEFMKYGFERSGLTLDNYIYSDDWKRRVRRHESDLVDLKNGYDYIYDIFLIDNHGNILYSVARESDLGSNILQGELKDTRFANAVRQTMATGEIRFSDFERYPPSRHILCGFFTSRLIDSDGRPIGVYAVKARIDKLQERLTNNGDVRHYLVGKDNKLRSPIDDNVGDVLIRHINTDALTTTHASKTHKDQRVDNYIGPSGKPTLGLAQPIKAINVSWLLVSEIDRAVALSSVKWLGRITLILFAFTILIVVLVSIMLARGITQPIAELVNGVNRAAAGDLQTPVTLSQDSEMSGLAQAFNRMLTQRQKYESKLVESTRVAQQASRAKSDFLAVMSHEIRTPMNGVLGMLTLLRRAKPGDAILHKVNVAYNSAQSLLSVINDILDFSKVEAGKLELEERPFNLQQQLEDVVGSFHQLAEEKGISLIFSSENTAKIVVGDANRLRQIITNLIGNALKFTEQGSVVVSARLESPAGDTHTYRFFGSIKDSGIGINPYQSARLFDAFTQVDASTKRKYGGTGLGLAIVKHLSELMGGSINVRSELGKGSEFYFDLVFDVPAAHAPPMVLDPPKNAVPAMALASPHYDRQMSTSEAHLSKECDRHDEARILIVEDNDINQQVVEAILNDANIAHDMVGNGQDALCKLNETEQGQGICYTLVLMDCQLPVMDGYDATARIRAGEVGEYYRTVPIIAMTAHAMKGDREKCLLAGMDDYVSKPIDDAILVSIIERWSKAQIQKTQNRHADDAESDKSSQAFSQRVADSLAQAQLPMLRIPENLKAFDLVNSPPEIASKPSLYLRLLGRYRVQACDSREQLGSRDLTHDQLVSIAHSLKGTSANLGVTAVWDASAELEKHIKAAASLGYHRQLSTLFSAIDAALDDITQLLTLNAFVEDENDMPSTQDTRPFDDLVTELKGKLELSAVVTPSLLTEFRQALRKAYPHLDTEDIFSAIRSFDYDEALEKLDEL